MAMIQCPECGKTISDKAVACPGCGCPSSEFCTEEDWDYWEGEPQNEIERMAREVSKETGHGARAVLLICRKLGIEFRGFRGTRKIQEVRKIVLPMYEERKIEYTRRGICPYCGARELIFEGDSDEFMLEKSPSGDRYYARHNTSKIQDVKCNACGEKWFIMRK